MGGPGSLTSGGRREGVSRDAVHCPGQLAVSGAQEAYERPKEVRGLQCPEEGCDGTLGLRESRHGPFYGCNRYPECKATHGAHPDGSPLGVPADERTRKARMRAHREFDRLWKNAPQFYSIQEEQGTPERGRAIQRIQRAARPRAYRWLADRLSMDVDDCHVGMMDEFTCELVVRLCRGVTAADVRKWYKRRQVKAWRSGYWAPGKPYDGPEFTEDEAARWTGPG